MNNTSKKWKVISEVGAVDLSKAREQMHQAVQLVSAVGRAFLPAKEDDSHANLEWLPNERALAGQWVGMKRKFRMALVLKDLQYLIIDPHNNILADFDLVGRNQVEAIDWLKSVFWGLGFNDDVLSLRHPYTIPIYATSKGEKFRINHPAVFGTLSNFFGNAHTVMQQLQVEHSNISPIRCWPHHFDIAVLITLDNVQGDEIARSIGVGFSPGDEKVPEPYFYVNCWPYPDLTDQDLPAISSGGKWNLEGWVGTVLTYNSLLQHPHQFSTTQEFFTSSIEALKQLSNTNV